MGIFPRRASADESCTYGIEMSAIGISQSCTAQVFCNGRVEIECDSEPKCIGDIIAAVNKAMQSLIEHINKHWWEYGKDIEAAMNECPELDKIEFVRNNLTKSEIMIKKGQNKICITGNALPKINCITGSTSVLEIAVEVGKFFRRAMMRRNEILESADRDIPPLQKDLAACQWLKNYIDSYFEHGVTEYDDKSMWCLMPVGKGAGGLIAHSVPLLIAQAENAGKRLDLVLGLNDGIDESEVINQWQADAEIIHLYVNESESTGKEYLAPLLSLESVFTDPERKDEPYVIGAGNDRHRIFVVHQEHTHESIGKNRLQRLFCRMLMDRFLLHPFDPVPSTILLADSETCFFETSTQNTASESTALAKMLEEMTKDELDLISAHSASVCFKKEGGKEVPDFDQEVLSIYRLLDMSHGKTHNVMHGGSTIGKFSSMLSLLTLICHRYPGSRDEDVHYTLLAHGLGMKSRVSESCSATNKVRQENPEQRRRWFSASAALRKRYGSKAFNGVTDFKGLIALAKKDPTLSDAIIEYNELIEYGSTHPDDLFVHGDWDAADQS